MKTICFIGMDGSGKSTQCKMLAKRLQQLGVEVKLIHLFTTGSTVSSRVQKKPLLKFFSQKLREIPTYGIKGTIKLLIGLISYFIDAWVTYILHQIKYRKKVVIYDRFFYDRFVTFGVIFDKTPWWIVNFAKFLPKSDMPIIMEVPSKVGNLRKPEDSLEKLEKSLKFYRILASILNIEVIDGTQNFDKIAEHIYRRVSKLIWNK